MTPLRRIHRIQRWLNTRNKFIPLCAQVHGCGKNANLDIWLQRCAEANRRFADELEWLCGYTLAQNETAELALRKLDEHGFETVADCIRERGDK